jgi:hypothetical protein
MDSAVMILLQRLVKPGIFFLLVAGARFLGCSIFEPQEPPSAPGYRPAARLVLIAGGKGYDDLRKEDAHGGKRP